MEPVCGLNISMEQVQGSKARWGGEEKKAPWLVCRLSNTITLAHSEPGSRAAHVYHAALMLSKYTSTLSNEAS